MDGENTEKGRERELDWNTEHNKSSSGASWCCSSLLLSYPSHTAPSPLNNGRTSQTKHTHTHTKLPWRRATLTQHSSPGALSLSLSLSIAPSLRHHTLSNSAQQPGILLPSPTVRINQWPSMKIYFCLSSKFLQVHANLSSQPTLPFFPPPLFCWICSPPLCYWNSVYLWWNCMLEWLQGEKEIFFFSLALSIAEWICILCLTSTSLPLSTRASWCPIPPHIQKKKEEKKHFWLDPLLIAI